MRHLSDEPKLAQSSPKGSTDEELLLKFAAECELVADKLLVILQDLEVPNDAAFGDCKLCARRLGVQRRRKIFRSSTQIARN
jgi:hypothetical protein